MNLSDCLVKAKKQLGPNGDCLGIEVLLAHTLGKGRKDLIISPDYVMTPQEEEYFWHLFDRFMQGEPVAYLINKKEFYGLEFYVDSRVLIPRPETEMLVEEVITFVQKMKIEGSNLNKKSVPVRILDVGTGSGCIAISLAKHLPFADITAVDISPDALQVAQKNAEHHKMNERIHLYVSDLLDKTEGPFDVIVANLPYIGEEKFNFVSREAREYEPHVALFGGIDGLVLYKKLFQQINEKAWKPSLVIGEFGFLQSDSMKELLNKYFAQTQWEIIKDLASIERMFVIKF